MAFGQQPDVNGDGDEEGGGSIFAEINITPLTDVFLVMVIIFMVSALAVQAESNHEKKQEQKLKKDQKAKVTSVKINLPPGVSAELEPTKSQLVIEVPLEGPVYIGGKAFRDDELDKMFLATANADKTTQVVLKADTGVAHGRVVNLMERAKQVGLTRLAIATGGG